ncbi:hypothetical protein X798_05211 [Onchocerca flexuosa]|uniref:Uncharacterized protein n=1 Tax=Onchocerca flexuosa TaxID=387005 RepID=A0A238BT04_9BILA|nr:hypothetical protein X798_05211 [Onchocerca flexuosa]
MQHDAKETAGVDVPEEKKKYSPSIESTEASKNLGVQDDAEQKLEQLYNRKNKEQERLIPPSNLTVNLPQLSLPTFNGDPRQWRHSGTVKNCQHHSTFTETKLTINNNISIVDSNPKLSSSVAQRNQHLSQLTISRKRPCIFRVKT